MTPDDVRGLLATLLPRRRTATVEALGDGVDNVAYAVDGDLVLRVAKDPDPAATAREAAVLAAVRGRTRVATPEPVAVDARRGCLVYRRLPGRPLATVPEPARVPATTTATLAGFLDDLRAIPTAPLRAAGVEDEDGTPAEWLDEARHHHARVAALVPAGHRAAVDAFLAAPAPPRTGPTPVLLHNDLGVEHVLVDPATRAVTGILDWADAALGDPAYDHAKLLRDLGPAAPVPPDAATGQRALFLARCSVFEELAYGADTGRRTYLDNARAAVVRLFPAQGHAAGPPWSVTPVRRPPS